MATSRSDTGKPTAYKPRHPEKTPFFAVLYYHYDKFKAAYGERFQKEYGRWRGVVDKVVGKYFQCGTLLGGFARLRCPNCGSEKLLALSCKTRGFCPSCSTKRALLWAEFVQEKVLRPVPHRHAVFTLPKMLRPYFKFHRELFEVKVFSMLREKGLITQELVEKIKSWKHTGFDAWIGPATTDTKEIAQIGIYTVRAPAASGRLIVDDGPRVKYFAKGTQPDRDIGGLFEPPSRTFDYLDWIARLTSHIAEENSQLVHYFGAYANAHRGKVAKAQSKPPDTSPATAEPEEDWIKARQKAWARLIRQVYEADPLLCDCGSKFEVISVIEARTQSDVVARILKHIKYHFDVLQLAARAPPVSLLSPEPQPDLSDSYYL